MSRLASLYLAHSYRKIYYIIYIYIFIFMVSLDNEVFFASGNGFFLVSDREIFVLRRTF